MQTIVGQIRNAIRPLTDELGFYLDTVRYGEYYHQIEFVVVSRCLSITFHGFRNENPHVMCTFSVQPLGKTFHGMYLFPALGLEIQYPPPLDLLMVPPPSDFFDDLNRLCKEIRSNYDTLSAAFEKDSIENTIHLYSTEFRKRDKERVIFPPSPPSTCRTIDDKEKGQIDEQCLDRILADYKILDRECQRLTISCGFTENKTDVSFYSNISSSSVEILIHSENDGSTGLYFIVGPWVDFLRKKFGRTGQPVVFSYRNVFRFFGIEYSYHPKGTFEDTKEFFQVLHDNAGKIFPAFSRNNLESVYETLKDTTENNEEEIRIVLKNLVELVD